MVFGRNKWRKYKNISNVAPILRRYFVMNVFDGILTMLGIIIGVKIAGVLEPHLIITAGISGIIALGVSGASSAYMTEKAERIREIKNLERALLTKLPEDGEQTSASRVATFYAAFVNGASPAIMALIILIPFFLANFGVIEKETAFSSSIILSFALLFSLGIYLAKISQESLLKYGIMMLLVGLIAGGLCLLASLGLES